MDEIWNYLAVRRKSYDAADQVVEMLREKFALLASHPLLGQSRDDLRPGLRIFSAGNYVILFYSEDNGVEIIGIEHASRDLEGVFRRGER